jgi:hypothetical protein
VSQPGGGGIEWVCADAPSLARGDFGWWHLNFRGWEQTLDWVTDYLVRHGPFDGVLGFSQGAALTSLLVGRRAPDGRVTPERPLSFGFAVMIGGFRSDSAAHAGLYAAADSYRLPSLHIMGKSDPVVPMADSMVLARQFAAPTVLTHPGGHVIPDTPEVLAGVQSFFADQAGR